MNWSNLKNNKCPACGRILMKHKGFMVCPNKDFSVNYHKFEKIVNDLYKPKSFQSEDDRLSELNNFGRKELTEGFLEEESFD